MLKIGITGNIASGKSVVEDYLKKSGFKTLCLDFATSKVYKEDQEFKIELLKLFNTADKKAIAGIVFEDKNKLKKLENLIYPKINKIMFDFFEKNKNERLVFVSGAMLYEAGYEKYFDKMIHVYADEKLRLERLIKRDGYSLDYAQKRIKSQLNDNIKLERADIVIKNEGSTDELNKKCEELIKELSIL